MSRPPPTLSHRERGIIGALILSLVLWQLPHGGLVLYPFKLLATWIHEMSHGLVMLICGAGFETLDIYRDTSGIAHAAAGTTQVGRALIASAGYMGASLMGAALLVVAQSGRASRIALGAMSLAMGLSALLWVNNSFGLTVAWAGCAAFAAMAVILRDRWAGWALSFVAAQACINAVLDIRVLFRSQLVINGEVVGASDAHRMASATIGSPTFWAAMWLAWSFVLFYVALRVARAQVDRLEARTASERPAAPA